MAMDETIGMRMKEEEGGEAMEMEMLVVVGGGVLGVRRGGGVLFPIHIALS